MRSKKKKLRNALRKKDETKREVAKKNKLLKKRKR